MRDLWVSLRRSVTFWVVVAAVTTLVVIGACGSANAADYEVRGGYRDGATVGFMAEAPVKQAHVGGLLEFGEDESVSLVARVSKLWSGYKVRPYIGAGAGVALQEVTTVQSFMPGRHHDEEGERSYRPFVVETTDTDSGLVLEGFVGLRGTITPGVLWNVELSARDTEAEDGPAVAAGIRFRK